MKKIHIGIFSVILLFLCGCNNVQKNTEINISNDNKRITYEGIYIADDESKVTITKIDDTYKILIDIVRLTSIDDGIGTIDERIDIMSFVATDASNNPIAGKIQWDTAGNIVLKFTNSTWLYLPNGTEISFMSTDKETENYKSYETAIANDFSNEYKLPYADIDSQILDSSYSTLKAQGNLKYMVESPDGFKKYTKYTKYIDDFNYYQLSGKIEYWVVQDDNIVGYVKYVGADVNSVNVLIKPEEFYDNPPQIIENGDDVLLGWQIKNGYVILSAIPTNDNGDWYYYKPMWFMHIKSLEQCNIEW